MKDRLKDSSAKLLRYIGIDWRHQVSPEKSVPAKTPTAEAERYLSQDEVNSIIKIALGPEIQYPICRHVAATHAVGVALACLAARTMIGNLTSLRDQFNICWGDLLREADYTEEKVNEHIQLLMELNSLFFCLTDDRPSISGSSRNFLSEVFCRFSEGRELLYRVIKDLRKSLELDIIGEMRDALQVIKQHKMNDQREYLHRLLRDKAIRLGAMCQRFDTALDQLEAIVAACKKDWGLDVDQLWNDGYCLPSALKESGSTNPEEVSA